MILSPSFMSMLIPSSMSGWSTGKYILTFKLAIQLLLHDTLHWLSCPQSFQHSWSWWAWYCIVLTVYNIECLWFDIRECFIAIVYILGSNTTWIVVLMEGNAMDALEKFMSRPIVNISAYMYCVGCHPPPSSVSSTYTSAYISIWSCWKEQASNKNHNCPC